MKFVDLFAGLGGFHIALKSLGHKCVFASELDVSLQETYYKNFKVRPDGDIREIKLKNIPPHDILCAGFPCQPFSKAGEQEGFKCPKWGDLIDYVIAVIEYHRPTFVLLENVPNLLSHNNGSTWNSILSNLKNLHYIVDYRKLSPHKFGIPQIRERVFVVASKLNLDGFVWPSFGSLKPSNITSILDVSPLNAKPITPTARKCLKAWQHFLERFPKDEQLPTFPIWANEFGANYPYERTTPYKIGKYRLRSFRGSLGQNLRLIKACDQFNVIPSYARVKEDIFPEWKVEFIRKNRDLYKKHKKWLNPWLREIADFPPSWQKLEWNCGTGKRNLWRYVIQFRASGVRVKKATTSPSLVAMTTTQVPIIAWEKRYMTINECARLQSLNTLRHFPETETGTYKALGNAVNSKIVKMVARNLLNANNNGRVAINAVARIYAEWRASQPLPEGASREPPRQKYQPVNGYPALGMGAFGELDWRL